MRKSEECLTKIGVNVKSLPETHLIEGIISKCERHSNVAEESWENGVKH